MSSPLRKQILEWGISEEDWNWVKHSVSDKTLMGFCGSRITLWSQRTSSFAARSWMRLRYSIHPRNNKMYQDLKKNFWWTRMKREIVKYVFECDTYRRVKANHLRPAGNLQPLSIPEWKWENICMNFIVGLPRTSHGYNSIWVIVDRLTKSAHFIPISTTYKVR
jgi:hypothetical protein